ncbi:MAG: EAL domain-containing protein [Frankiales bacterium]|nr:EAL domain-containing protein [Frankiales bacterium]
MTPGGGRGTHVLTRGGGAMPEPATTEGPAEAGGRPGSTDPRWWIVLICYVVVTGIAVDQDSIRLVPLLWVVVAFAAWFGSVRAVTLLSLATLGVAILFGARWGQLGLPEFWVRFAIQVAVAAGAVLLVRSMRRRDRRLHRAEDDVRVLAENASDLALRIDGDGTVVWAAAAEDSPFGWRPDELVGRRLGDLVHPDDDAGSAVVRLKTRDGGYRSVSLKRTPMPAEGRPDAATVVGVRDVEDLVRAREDAAEGRAVLRSTLDSLSDPHTVMTPVRDDDGRIVDFRLEDANRAACRYNGMSREQLVGTTLLGLLPGHAESGLLASYVEVMETGTPYVATDLAYHQELLDDDRVYDVQALRIGGRLFCTWRDVSERHEASRSLAESEGRFRLLAENASDIVYQCSPDRTITWISPAVAQALGWQPDELVGEPCEVLVHPDDRPAVAAALDTLARTGTVDALTARYRSASGALRWMSVRPHLLRGDDGGPTGAVVALSDVTAERAARDELAYRAFHDPLTGLRNRAWILDALEADLRAVRRTGGRVGVLFVDLDNFKLVNDSLGHLAGDTVLAAIARRIAEVLRPTDRVGRFGGDEFVVVVPAVEDSLDVEQVAERISRAIGQELDVEGHRIVPSASLGIALSTPESTPASLLRDTDSALFRAKAAGRARWHFFDEEMHAQAVARLTTEDELRRAVAAGEFVVHYQPIVALGTGVVTGHEALIRWNHPDRGLLPPSDFLAVAEESGLIVEIGHQVLHQVCALLAERRDLPGPVSVNKSPVQIAGRGWREAFLATLREHDVDPGRLVVEVTETAVLSVIDQARDDLRALRDLGVGVHVDDFGTGYSSISLLRDLPVTGLKLDRSFTAHLDDDETAGVLSEGLAALAAGLHLIGIAEGVETLDQARTLRRHGWTHGQGYLFSKPKPCIDSATSEVEPAYLT